MPKGAKPDHKTYHVYNIPPDLYKDFKYLTIMMDVSLNSLFIVAMQEFVEYWTKNGKTKTSISKLREIDKSLEDLFPKKSEESFHFESLEDQENNN